MDILTYPEKGIVDPVYLLLPIYMPVSMFICVLILFNVFHIIFLLLELNAVVSNAKSGKNQQNPRDLKRKVRSEVH